MYSAKQASEAASLQLLHNKRYYERLEDRELIILSQNKDHCAFEQLIKRNQRVVYSLLYQLAPDWSHHSDLAQEVFIRVWRSISSLRDPVCFRSWLNQIVTNIFYDNLRKRPRLSLVSLDEPINAEMGEDGCSRDVEDRSALPDDVLQRAELSLAIEKAIAKLPEQFRTAIVLRELHGLSYEEIAALTNSEKGTVKSRISRARDKVQAWISPYFKDCA